MITDRQARATKPGDKAKPTGIPGMTLQPTATKGRGKWLLRYTSPATGKRRDMGMGTFPDVGVAEALKRGREAREAIAGGLDPIQARQEQQAVQTFEQAARARWEILRPGYKNAKDARQWLATLERYIFPTLGAVRVDKLTPQHFASALHPLWLAKPETANRVKQRCSDVMAVAWATGATDGNPLAVVDKLLAKRERVVIHQPAMPWETVPEFMRQHLTAEPLLGARACLLWAILTCARSGEARGATWDEIDRDNRLWLIPGERMKMKRPHRVPLSEAAVALLDAQPRSHGALIFPSMRGKHLSDMALTSVLRKAEATSDIPGRVATAHGFRASFRNWAADSGYSSDAAERALAHAVGNKVQAAYERTDQLDNRRELMEKWAGHVTSAKV